MTHCVLSEDSRVTVTDEVSISAERSSNQRRPCGLEWAQASWIRWIYVLFWWWLNPILNRSTKQGLRDDDLFDLCMNDTSERLLQKLEVSYQAYEEKHKEIITWRIIAKAFWKESVLTGLILFPYFAAKIAQPLLLKGIVTNIHDANVPSYVSYLYAVGLGVTKTILVLIHHQFFFCTTRIGMQIRISLSAIIYKKLLSMPTQALGDMTTGHLVNLISNDTSKFEILCTYIHHLWAGPLQALVIFGLIWNEIGLPALFGYGVFLLQIPLQLYFSKRFRTYRKTTMRWSDERIKMINEILTGGEIVKMYRWEEALEAVIEEIRLNEFRSIRQANRIRAFNMAIHFLSLPLVSLATFGGSWLTGRTLSSANIFTILSFFGIMRDALTIGFPYGIETINESLMASRRIDRFMNASKRTNSRTSEQTLRNTHYPLTGSITMRKASFTWTPNQPAQLIDIHLNLKSGSLNGIIGPIGSGKSSLLNAILGEMVVIEGYSKVDGQVAYVSQTPWIFAGTIRENVLFHKPYDAVKYDQILRACCLSSDLQMLSAGDQTMIGEKGVNLSGGQKARLSLARVLYAEADIYLFDDPLAAVDPSVANQIFQDCISNRGLLRHKTRVLVTHQTQFLSDFDYCILLNHGMIKKQGPSGEFGNMMDTIGVLQQRNEFNADGSVLTTAKVDKSSIITDETSGDGNVRGHVWLRLFTASYGWTGLILLLIFMVLSQACHDTTNKWLGVWSSKSAAVQRQSHYAYVYLGLTIGTCVLAILRADYFFHIILRGASIFHTRMFQGVLYSSLRFYESNPVGRILNRFSKDQQVLDELLPVSFFDATQCLILVLGSIVIIGMANPWVLFILLLLVPTFIWLRRIYLRTSRNIKRLDAASRSPIYASFSSSLSGLVTIRAFRMQNQLLKSFLDKINTNTRAWFLFICCSRWFGLRLDLLTCAFTFFTAILSVIIRNHIDPTSLALGLVYVINLSELFQWGVRQSAETENHMISAERIDEYTRIPSESDFYQAEIQAPSNWPMSGKIEFCNFQFRYRPELPPVLKGINLIIEPGQKIGIIGRTGSGKSSLFQALFRLTDRATIDGQVMIDGVDISRISLNQLRSNLNIIPQSPVLFSNTIRYNLDPFHQHTDEQIWRALEAVQLKTKVKQLKDQLQTAIAEYGSNFSVGECQLICVARAMLKPSAILLIDEATAHVDQQTDAIIQKILREKFASHTVLTIAHRINTVMDSDKIVVMNGGTIAAYGTPEELLSQKNELLVHPPESEDFSTYL